MTRRALEGIAQVGENDEMFADGDWFAPFDLDFKSAMERIISPYFSDFVSLKEPSDALPGGFALPPDAPNGFLLVWPDRNRGMAVLIEEQEAGPALTAAWPFIDEGTEHEIAVECVIMAQDRLRAIVEGSVADMQISWFDSRFPLDRMHYAAGSIHRIALAGIAHRFERYEAEPIFIGPEAQSYPALRDANPAAVGTDGRIRLETKGMAAVFPAAAEYPNWYSVQGPVRRITRLSDNILGCAADIVRMTIARVDGGECDVDLDVLVTDVVRQDRPLPGVGDDVRALVWLQGRIRRPNIARQSDVP